MNHLWLLLLRVITIFNLKLNLTEAHLETQTSELTMLNSGLAQMRPFSVQVK